MEAVTAFNSELSSLCECKPPVSKAKMTSVTKAAIKAVKFYKHVVQSVEKFIQKSRSEYKVPGLYVIDSIVRQSRHQFGADKDVFAGRFARNFGSTFQHLFKCPQEEKSKIVRVLNLWQKNAVFSAEVIQPLLDMANPNHAIHQQSGTPTSLETPTKLKHQQQEASGWSGWSNDNSNSQMDNDVALKTVTQLLSQPAASANVLQASSQNSTSNQAVVDNNLLLHLQQLASLLAQQGQHKLNEQENTVKFNKKLLDFDYSDEEDDEEEKKDEPAPAPDSTALAFSMAQNLLSNPDLLRHLQDMQTTLQQTEVLKSEISLQEQFGKQRLWTAEDFTQILNSQMMHPQTSTFPVSQPVNIPAYDLATFSALGLNTVPNMLQNNAMSSVPTLNPAAAPAYVPPVSSVNQEVVALPPPAAVTSDIYDVIEIDDDDHSPEEPEEERNNRENSRDSRDRCNSERERDRDDRSNRSPARRRDNRSRSRSRSRKRGRRSRSRSRSPVRRAGGGGGNRRSRSRSGSRSRSRHRQRDSRRSRSREREREREKEREKEKERKKRGLPPLKREHLSVCSTTLWLGHVSKLVSEEDLADTFGEFGDIVAIDLIPPRGCAFVCMNRRQDAFRALQKLKNLKLQGKTITMAWAPGKGVKGKDYKDYWDADLGVSYIPYFKLPEDLDMDALEDGGMVDEDSVPEKLKGLQKERERERQKQCKEGLEMEVKPEEKEINVTNEQQQKSGIIADTSQQSASQTALAPPPMMPPPLVQTQFTMPVSAMVSGQVPIIPLPVGVPPPGPMMMVPPVSQPPLMSQSLSVLGGMPFGITPPNLPSAIAPQVTTGSSATAVSSTTTSSVVDQSINNGTPMQESQNDSPDPLKDNSLTQSDNTTASAASATDNDSKTVTMDLGHSSIPLPPGNVPGVISLPVTSSGTTTDVTGDGKSSLVSNSSVALSQELSPLVGNNPTMMIGPMGTPTGLRRPMDFMPSPFTAPPGFNPILPPPPMFRPPMFMPPLGDSPMRPMIGPWNSSTANSMNRSDSTQDVDMRGQENSRKENSVDLLPSNNSSVFNKSGGVTNNNSAGASPFLGTSENSQNRSLALTFSSGKLNLRSSGADSLMRPNSGMLIEPPNNRGDRNTDSLHQGSRGPGEGARRSRFDRPLSEERPGGQRLGDGDERSSAAAESLTDRQMRPGFPGMPPVPSLMNRFPNPRMGAGLPPPPRGMGPMGPFGRFPGPGGIAPHPDGLPFRGMMRGRFPGPPRGPPFMGGSGPMPRGPPPPGGSLDHLGLDIDRPSRDRALMRPPSMLRPDYLNQDQRGNYRGDFAGDRGIDDREDRYSGRGGGEFNNGGDRFMDPDWNCKGDSRIDDHHFRSDRGWRGRADRNFDYDREFHSDFENRHFDRSRGVDDSFEDDYDRGDYSNRDYDREFNRGGGFDRDRGRGFVGGRFHRGWGGRGDGDGHDFRSDRRMDDRIHGGGGRDREFEFRECDRVHDRDRGRERDRDKDRDRTKDHDGDRSRRRSHWNDVGENNKPDRSGGKKTNVLDADRNINDSNEDANDTSAASLEIISGENNEMPDKTADVKTNLLDVSGDSCEIFTISPIAGAEPVEDLQRNGDIVTIDESEVKDKDNTAVVEVKG